MKKGLVIGGVIVLLAAAAGALFAFAESDQTKAIKDVLENGRVPSAKEQDLLDLDDDSTITKKDLMKAKFDAALHKNSEMPLFYQPTAAKQLGRTAYHEDTETLWFSLSGSGIEFRFMGENCSFTLVGDSACTQGETVAPRYAYYVDGELKEKTQLTEPERTVSIEGSATDYKTVRIVKLSESAQSSMGIRDLCVEKNDGDGESGLSATDPAPHLIEFIGDSITCGYGVDGEFNKDKFMTANEDAEKAYAIKTAKKLGADYSLVSYSGHGILSGYTSDGTLNKTQLVPKYYTQVGHASPVIEERHKIQDDEWDFSVQPDLIVINLGTNDASYTVTSSPRQKEFAEKYTEFLKLIREKNPNAPILCTLGIMGTTLCDAIDLAVSNYTQETGDTNISTMRFDMQQDADGYAVDWHPSEKTHEKASDKLTAYIKDWLKW